MDMNMINLFVRLFMGAAAGFLAIMVWSKTRSGEWLCMILGVLLFYIQSVFSFLVELKLLTADLFSVPGFPLFDVIGLVLQVLPLCLFCLGFILFLVKNR
jgi:hypothetical protein